jgi:AraC-like DNA-binding protein
VRFTPSADLGPDSKAAEWPPSIGQLRNPQAVPHCQRRDLLVTRLVTVSTIECGSHDGEWLHSQTWKDPAIVLVRLGRFARRVNGRTSVVDATQGYVQQAGEEELIQHIGDLGHRCTVLTLRPDALPALWRARARLMTREFRTSPATDLAHRRLLTECRRGGDAATIADMASALLADLFDCCVRAPRRSHRPSTAAGTRRIVDIARELATVSADAPSLQSLAAATSISPHHLTRVFKESTGMTLSRYRNRVRVRLAMEWLAEGEDDLTRIAHDLGFADHAHFSRTVLAELGLQPRMVRSLLYAPGALNVAPNAPGSAPPGQMTAG